MRLGTNEVLNAVQDWIEGARYHFAKMVKYACSIDLKTHSLTINPRDITIKHPTKGEDKGKTVVQITFVFEAKERDAE